MRLTIDIENGKVLNIGIAGEAKSLEWHQWKEAFMGRLIGFREWRSKHGFKNMLELHRYALRHVSGGLVNLETVTLN